MKITIFQKRPFDFQGTDGEQVKGVMYGCFNSENKPLEFSSKDETKKVYPGATSFDPKRCEELPIVARFFGGKVKWREDESVGIGEL